MGRSNPAGPVPAFSSAAAQPEFRSCLTNLMRGWDKPHCTPESGAVGMPVSTANRQLLSAGYHRGFRAALRGGRG